MPIRSYAIISDHILNHTQEGRCNMFEVPVEKLVKNLTDETLQLLAAAVLLEMERRGITNEGAELWQQ